MLSQGQGTNADGLCVALLGVGILQVLTETCAEAKIPPEQLGECHATGSSSTKINVICALAPASIVIGTTHFINAVLTYDANRLERVALFRLGSPYTEECPPFCNFPQRLRSILEGPWRICKGGLQISGQAIGDVALDEIREQCKVVKAAGIRAAVVCGIYSPLDQPGNGQEDVVANLIREEIPGIDVVCSRDVGQVGFLEREAASILNASILHFARVTIASFQSAIRALGSNAALFLSRNDGTLCSAQDAARLPVRTFSSGATNSLRGAAVLAGLDKGALAQHAGQILVADIGGASTDIGVLLKSGFPRKAAAFVEIAGLRTSFSMPDVQSIGIGGGSVVHIEDDRVTVGPDSIGYRLTSDAICFGGETATASDVAIASGAAHFGTQSDRPGKHLSASIVEGARVNIQKQLQGLINRMKTTPEPATLILVGGGNCVAPSNFEGVQQVIRPEMADCANAIGAACARVAGEIDTIVTVPPGGWDAVFEGLKARVIAEAIDRGASKNTVEVVEVQNMPIQASKRREPVDRQAAEH